VAEFTQTEHPGRLVPIFVGDDGNAGGLAAVVEFDPDGLNLAHDTVLQADPNQVAAMNDCGGVREALFSQHGISGRLRLSRTNADNFVSWTLPLQAL
jgi:hypothetical protein